MYTNNFTQKLTNNFKPCKLLMVAKKVMLMLEPNKNTVKNCYVYSFRIAQNIISRVMLLTSILLRLHTFAWTYHFFSTNHILTTLKWLHTKIKIVYTNFLCMYLFTTW